MDKTAGKEKPALGQKRGAQESLENEAGTGKKPEMDLAGLSRFDNFSKRQNDLGLFFQSKPAAEFFGGNRAFLFRTRSRAFDDRQELAVCA